MFFGKLSLTNFGPFHHFDMAFKDGMNVICGGNGTGKTQLTGAMLAALIGESAIRINASRTGPSKVEVALHDGGTTEKLKLSVSIDHDGHTRVKQHGDYDGEVPPTAPLSQRLRAMLSDPQAPRLLLRRNPDDWKPLPLTADRVEALLPPGLRHSRSWLDMRKEGLYRGNVVSGGQQAPPLRLC